MSTNFHQALSTSGTKVFFGAAGAGAYSLQISNIVPDFFVDNDVNKHDTLFKGIPVYSPNHLLTLDASKLAYVLLTSGYVASIRPQLLSLNIPSSKILIPPKSWLGHPLFESTSTRLETVSFISLISASFNGTPVVCVGGTALGFCRDNDFIVWDNDVDLVVDLRAKQDFCSFISSCLSTIPKWSLIDDAIPSSICFDFVASDSSLIPFGVKFVDTLPRKMSLRIILGAGP